MPDGSGAVMIDGKMQDDATWKQAKVLVDLARLVAGQGPGNGGALRAMKKTMNRAMNGHSAFGQLPAIIMSLHCYDAHAAK